MYYAEYETQTASGFAVYALRERKEAIEADSRRRACQLLMIAETDRRTTYELWGVIKNDGRVPREQIASDGGASLRTR